jgi:hypothetical protein
MKPKKKVKKIMKKQPKTTVPDQCCCEKKAAREILKRNMKGDSKFNESYGYIFAEQFLVSLLREQEEVAPDATLPDQTVEAAPEDFTPEKNQQDFDNSLDQSTNENQFDIEGISPDVTLETIKKVKDWAVKLNDFEKFLNNPSEDSLHRILADNDRAGSLLRGITRKASDSITRIAGEIAKLKEVLNTFVNTAPKKMRDTEQLKLGS